eukprot:CAMPEP_0168344432 /NCGR_PEP_ID=MMETSP0213-20121227/16815_1 /TAXON_ID=151035 /ORGANISM="Euplotes harpa, Strain FSP1.4" /LENGTH=118 /DNA_ID=CAMNT_0008352177 /DNA_START=326 /DNA_END=677 /DNA_ORIENTATION=-
MTSDGFLSELLELLVPVLEALKGGPVGDVKDHHGPAGLPVVIRYDAFELVLASGVPEVHLGDLISEQVEFVEVFIPRCRPDGLVVPVRQPIEQASLANSHVADEDYLNSVVAFGLGVL